MALSQMMAPVLHILQVTASDSGGAARIAWNLHGAYTARGYQSRLVVGYRHTDDPRVINLPHETTGSLWSQTWWRLARRMEPADRAGRWARKLAQPSNWLDWYHGVEQMDFPGTWRLLELNGQPPDLVHCHNLHLNYFDLRALPYLSHRVPLILTLHDAWLLSGHCAHSLGCARWKIGCGQCPDLTLYPAIRRDASAYNWQRKCMIYSQSRLYVVTPSRWLMDKVEQSMLAPAAAKWRVIPNGMDLSVFYPADRAMARSELGLPMHRNILLFSANEVRRNPWKDYQTLRAAIARLAGQVERPVLFVALGEDAPAEQIGRAEVRFIPFVSRQETVVRYYQAADVYLHAARADTFPNTVLEAMACGIPVVATAVGGIPEQIEDGATGYLVPCGDAEVMATRVAILLEDDSLRQDMGLRAVQAARDRFDLSRQVDDYLEWYQDVRSDWIAWQQTHPIEGDHTS